MSYIRYKIEKQQVSYDSGVTWFDTSVTRNGDYAGTYSTLPECETGGDTSYSGQYFTIESAVDNNVVKFRSFSSRTISASTDGGSTWSGYTASNNNSPTIATLNMGQKILIKGLNSTYFDLSGNTGYISDFNVSGNYIVYGNIMSLIYGDLFATATTLTGNHCFEGFFSSKENLISAENLVLPATTLSRHCYMSMFSWCTGITKAPVLPAASLNYMCYVFMFWECTNLSHVTCLATDISYTYSGTKCTGGWLSGVAASGTFVKAASMTGWPTGSDGIPEGWTVQNA